MACPRCPLERIVRCVQNAEKTLCHDRQLFDPHKMGRRIVLREAGNPTAHAETLPPKGATQKADGASRFYAAWTAARVHAARNSYYPRMPLPSDLLAREATKPGTRCL